MGNFHQTAAEKLTEPKPVEVSAIINGEKFISHKRIKRENPANPEEIVGYFPENTLEETRQAIDAAYEAFPAWAATPLEERKHRIQQAADRLSQCIPEYKVLMTRENGKVLADSENELVFAVTICNYALKVAEEILQDEVLMDDGNGYLAITKQPVGVVAAITAWNYPIDLCLNKIVPAVITGNTVVVKPSPMAPLTVSKVIEIFADEMPPGVINLIHGPAAVGIEITSNPKVGKIAFTGGTPTGKQIFQNASGTIKKITLELGGNDPAILLKDADLSEESIIRLVIGTFLTTGQICMAAKRIYVHESINDKFLNTFKKVADSWIKVGNGLNPEATVGPLNNNEQKEFVQELLEDARARGATITPLGHILDQDSFQKGYFLQPTLVTNVKQDYRIVKEEQFGPTVPVLTFKTDEEAVYLANDSLLGLTSSVWSRDVSKAMKLARQLQAGYTFINTHSIPGVDIRSPFGGFKQSGIGREYGLEGFRDYVELHTISYPKSGGIPVTAF